jgi:hypothetical protein
MKPKGYKNPLGLYDYFMLNLLDSFFVKPHRF